MTQLTNIRKNFKGTKKRQKIAPLQNLSLPRVREARRSYMCLAYGEEITRNKKKTKCESKCRVPGNFYTSL